MCCANQAALCPSRCLAPIQLRCVDPAAIQVICVYSYDYPPNALRPGKILLSVSVCGSLISSWSFVS
jgi:hypothetical protein